MRHVRKLLGELPLPARSFGTGSVGALDVRRKRRGKKQPLGFVAPKKKR